MFMRNKHFSFKFRKYQSIRRRDIMLSFEMIFVVLFVSAFVTIGLCEDETTFDDEAKTLALEASGQLLAPESLTQKITEDLKAIRDAYPAVSEVTFNPPWVPGELLAIVNDDQLAQIRSQYGNVTSDRLFNLLVILRFETQYNPVVLAEELVSKNLTESADPNNILGDGDSIKYNPKTGVYTFKKGWGDCPAGCINEFYWEFSVSPTKSVKLLKTYGHPSEVDEESTTDKYIG